jgi:hypothetical protein
MCGKLEAELHTFLTLGEMSALRISNFITWYKPDRMLYKFQSWFGNTVK